MPVSFEVVKEMYHSESPWLKTATEKTDSKLSDPKWVRDWKCGGGSIPTYWDIVISGEATNSDKEKFIEIYEGAGWKRVKVKNSSENGERPGISVVTLYGDL